MTPLRVWLVEPYYGGSHRRWADGYRHASTHDVSLLTHEAQFWKWRLHGAHVTLAEEAAALGGTPDIVLASSMVNLAAFLGAARRSVQGARAVLYMHENQLAYPLSPRDREDATHAMVNWSSVAAADLVWFNSAFHLEHFFDDVAAMLRRFPDRTHGHVVAPVRERSEVMPVGVDVRRLPTGPKGEPPLIIWNHRWEHDKDPDALVTALEALAATDACFRVAVCGERFVSEPARFGALQGIVGDRLVHCGFATDEEYTSLLADASIVLSTARQEFFGVAVVEAMAAGAVPVLPNRLVYPERIDDARCLYERDPVPTLLRLLEDESSRIELSGHARDSVQQFDWSVVAPAMDVRLTELASGSLNR